ncbi:MAG: tRNA pseudouridine(55) synthase TruB [Bacteroidota bacterium]
MDKPIGWTSFDVINKLRYALRKRYGQKKFKVGHAGTLDPLATGLLLICTGKWTKKLAELTGLPKSYTGSFALGATTPSYDRETEIDERFGVDHITLDMLEKARKSLTGDIEQLPPMFSAVKVDGQRLYEKARAGQEVERKARAVTVHEFRLGELIGLPQVGTFPESSDPRATASSKSNGMDNFPESSDAVTPNYNEETASTDKLPQIDFLVSVSKGTYIRTLAYDFGRALQSGAYLASLCRTRVGPYELEDAWDLDALVEYINIGSISDSDT